MRNLRKKSAQLFLADLNGSGVSVKMKTLIPMPVIYQALLKGVFT